MATTGKRPNSPWLSPYLTVRDADAAIDFYQRAFGFELREAIRYGEGKAQHVEMTWNDALIMFAPEGAFGSTCKAPRTLGIECPVNLYVYCDDVDVLFARATGAGAKALVQPQDTFWGDRYCKLEDPDGHIWGFATYKGEPSGS